MIVNFKKKFSIIHIPKTGGTSIKKSIIKENLGKDIYFFHKKLYVYPEFYKKTKEIKTKLKYSHLTLSDLDFFYPEIFTKMKDFNFYAAIRDPNERFISSLIQYFGEKKIDLSKIDNSLMNKLIKKIIFEIKNDKFLNDISLFSFKRQSEYIFYNNEQIVKNIYKTQNLDKLIKDLNSKYGIYFGNILRENKSGKIQNQPFGPYYISKFLPKYFKETIKNIYNFLLPDKMKIFTLKYENTLKQDFIFDFINEYYEKDFIILKKINEN